MGRALYVPVIGSSQKAHCRFVYSHTFISASTFCLWSTNKLNKVFLENYVFSIDIHRIPQIHKIMRKVRHQVHCKVTDKINFQIWYVNRKLLRSCVKAVENVLHKKSNTGSVKNKENNCTRVF